MRICRVSVHCINFFFFVKRLKPDEIRYNNESCKLMFVSRTNTSCIVVLQRKAILTFKYAHTFIYRNVSMGALRFRIPCDAEEGAGQENVAAEPALIKKSDLYIVGKW